MARRVTSLPRASPANCFCRCIFIDSVLTHAVQFGKRGEASSDWGDYAGNMRQTGEARSPLGRAAEESFDGFCKQVLQVVVPLKHAVLEARLRSKDST